MPPRELVETTTRIEQSWPDAGSFSLENDHPIGGLVLQKFGREIERRFLAFGKTTI